MSTRLLKRLNNELKTLLDEPLKEFELTNYENIMIWEGIIIGPPNTPFENGRFPIKFTFDSDYPFNPPSIKFLTSIFHPNIYRDGKICLDILETQNWAPATQVKTIILSLIVLFLDPNPDSPANRDAAILFKENRSSYDDKIRKEIEINLKK